jgi:holo-[acyl-carrier protein] synthase
VSTMRPFKVTPQRDAQTRRRSVRRPVRARGCFTLGADLVEIAQVERSIGTFGDRYLRRVFTARELTYCAQDGRDAAPHLAARFAAKEATLKALRAGDEAVDWRWVEIERHPDGHCTIALHGSARGLAARRGVHDLCVSLSHDGGYAIAVVMAERSPVPAAPSRLACRMPQGAYGR